MATTTKAPTTKADVLIRNESTVFVFCPLSAAAKAWFNENVQSEAYQWFGNALVVDHRFAWGLGQGLKDAGFVLE
jgi:hypothetical protein